MVTLHVSVIISCLHRWSIPYLLVHIHVTFTQEKQIMSLKSIKFVPSASRGVSNGPLKSSCLQTPMWN